MTRLADMFETFLQAFIAVMDKDSAKGQELLAKDRQAAEETQTLLKEEIKEKLAKAEAKNKAKSVSIEVENLGVTELKPIRVTELNANEDV